MPGYMMHLCEAAYIENIILNSDKGDVDTVISRALISVFNSPDSTNEFLLGTVLPDAVSDKSLTHFRPPWQDNLITKYPNMHYLTERHNPDHLTAADLGILAHLYMDSIYVEEFWPRYFQFEDSSGKPTCVSNNIDHVKMTAISRQSDETIIPIRDFFSDRYFYGDYNITNPLFQIDFAPAIPNIAPVSLTISECNAFSPEMLRRDLSLFVSAEPPVQKATTNVFPYDDLKEFTVSCADRFLYLY